MRKVLLTFFVGSMIGLPLTAQVAGRDPYGPAVWFLDPATGAKTTTGQNFAELGNLNFNTTNVAQLCILPDPRSSGRYMGVATVTKVASSTMYDFLSFTWTPGSAPVVTTDCDTLNGPADEFQGSMTLDGLTFVGDTGAGHPVGNGVAIIASRAALGTQFGNMRVIAGVPGGYIDPQLGVINGRTVLFWADPTGSINVGEIDTNPASGSYGNVTNSRQAVPPQPVSGFVSCHSPTPTYDATGEARGLIFSVYTSTSSSDPHYSSTPDLSRHVAATALANMKPMQLYDDGSDWDNNPAAIKGTFLYADYGNAYSDPLRIEACTLSSCLVPRAGGTVTNVMQLPMSIGTDTVIAAVNYGIQRINPPIDPNAIGLVGYGNLGVGPVFGLTLGPVSNLEITASFPVRGPLPASVVLLAQGLAFNLTQGEIYLTNVAHIEVQ